MATRKATAEDLKRIEELAKRWGKIIVREHWGDQGPGLDVDLTQMEDIGVAAMRGLLAGTLESATQQQASQLGERFCRDNLNPNGGDWFTPTLSADGKEPYTHAQCSVALTDSEYKLFAGFLVDLTGAKLPADFDAQSKQQKQDYLKQQDAALKGISCGVNVMANDGVWDAPAAKLADMALEAASVDVMPEPSPVVPPK